MGLGIAVGWRCDVVRHDPEHNEPSYSEFEQLTLALAREGIDWREPEVLHEPGDSADFEVSFPYSYLTHLRRIYALVQRDEPLTPASAVSREQHRRDRAVDDETLFASHLLCHSDTDGYYIPIDMDAPLILLEAAAAGGGAGVVGSCQRLRTELAGFAGALGIRLEKDGTLATEQIEAVAAEEDDVPFAAERYTWVGLYRACETSIRSGHAIVFW
jgi:hypothetical protein